jgi:hypothetical protein
MKNFVQGTEYEMYIHANFEYLDIYRFLQLITSNLIYYNFLQCNNAQNRNWSSLCQRYTRKDYVEIYFVFFWVLLYFLHILEFYVNF